MSWWEANEPYREVPANREPCSDCGESHYWWELREEGRCPLCDLRVRLPDPPRPPPSAEVIDININRKEK